MIVLKAGFDGFATYKMFDTCIAQLKFSKANNWLDAYKGKVALPEGAYDNVSDSLYD